LLTNNVASRSKKGGFTTEDIQQQKLRAGSIQLAGALIRNVCRHVADAFCLKHPSTEIEFSRDITQFTRRTASRPTPQLPGRMGDESIELETSAT